MSIRYYNPDPTLVEYLHQELQGMESDEIGPNAEEKIQLPRRSEHTRNKIARKKHYNIDIIFQSFTNVLYFLEFIRDHYESLGGIFEEDLKDLFGYNKYYSEDEFPSNLNDFQEGHHNNPGGPLQRFMDAIILRDPTQPIKNKDSLDFRTVVIADIFIHTSSMELYQRFTEDDERDMMINDSKRFKFWANFLAKQVKDRSKNATRRIGYVPYKNEKNYSDSLLKR